MSAATRAPVRAGGVLARERLALYRRHAELVRRQEAALAQGDVAGFQALAEEAAALRGALGPALAAPPLSEDPEAASGPFVAEVAELLRMSLGAGERIQARLNALRSEAARSVRGASEGRRHALGYVRAGGAAAAPRLDRTL